MIRLALLFHAIGDTDVAEDQERFEAFMGEVRRTYSRKAVDLLMIGVVLSEGMEKGELPAETFDGMVGALESAGLLSEVQGLLSHIERRS